jgi:NitT/TauT family transport system substrate-binding protein
MRSIHSRRDFLASLTSAGAAGVLGARPALAEEGPPEVTTIRLRRDPSICVAPWYIAEDLLRAEGFSRSATCQRNSPRLASDKASSISALRMRGPS